jgi:hypothetical protein
VSVPTYHLKPHPDHAPALVDSVQVEVWGSRTDLMLRYHVGGRSKLIWPQAADPTRADGLWRTTCFELFLRPDDHEQYFEFNFSPSKRWAAYAFTSYRKDMVPLEVDTPPDIEPFPGGVEANCLLDRLPRGALQMALAAVIEEEGGVKSYWSLAHPPGLPDFHHPACFTARLPAVGGA